MGQDELYGLEAAAHLQLGYGKGLLYRFDQTNRHWLGFANASRAEPAGSDSDQLACGRPFLVRRHPGGRAEDRGRSGQASQCPFAENKLHGVLRVTPTRPGHEVPSSRRSPATAACSDSPFAAFADCGRRACRGLNDKSWMPRTASLRPTVAGRVAPNLPDGESSLFLFRFYEAAARDLTDPARCRHSPRGQIADRHFRYLPLWGWIAVPIPWPAVEHH